ncbi:MAG TPA: MBL fold metallo-hydrolase [Gemmatimonadaceae bacterium]|nr:MBL fold metallo-hydrolase [Gemmatimonadaceae bacterium]
MEIFFAGAAREVTGSSHVLRVGERTVILDCGMFQGRRRESFEKNRRLLVDVKEIDAVVASHAHIDHIGRLPVLTRAGYDKKIWATPATRDLSAVMLADSAMIQVKDAEHLTKRNKEAVEPLYGVPDAARVTALMMTISYNRAFDVTSGVRATFIDAGHILGSASVVLECTEGGAEKRVVFSGDIGRKGLPIIRDPEIPTDADVLIMESTYGDRDHESVAGAQAELARIVRECAAKGGKVFIPAFAVGRVQEILYDLHVLVRDSAIPAIPIYIDSPLATDVTSIFQMHPDCFDDSEVLVQAVQELFRFGLVQFTRQVSESKALNTMRGPMIVIAASGMVESGRIVHHIAHGASDPRNTILIVGYQAEHTLGRRIVERQPVLRVFGDEVPLRATVEVLNGYSAHADRSELLEWLRGVKRSSPRLQRVFLVHGEPRAQLPFAELLKQEGLQVEMPALGERFVV